MKFTFQYQVPNKHLVHPDVQAVLTVEAEVVNVGTKNVTPFLHKVSAAGPIALWNLKTSGDLFNDVSTAAIATAELYSVNNLIDKALTSEI